MLNKNDVIPLYKQLQEILKRQILSGEKKPREQILSEVELANKYNVSVITARKAVNMLAEEGLVEKKQGKGTFVATGKYHRNLQEVLSFSEVCLLNGTIPGSKLLECKKIAADKKTLEKLERSDDKELIYISRLRFSDGEPIAIETNSFPISFSFLLNENLDNVSLFKILKKRMNIEIASSRRTLEICRATESEANFLNIKKGAPLLLIRSIAYSRTNDPVFVGTQLINGERYKITM